MNTTNQIKLFIVDDNKVFRMALKADLETAFKNKFVEIHSFETGELCMGRFKNEMPELVILDYHLNSNYPGAADGIKVLDWIKEVSPETIVIILTADDHINIAVKSFKHGASDYVVKTETQFKKINYSLLNIFKMMEAKSEAKRYKQLLIGFFLCVVLVALGLVAIQILNPSAFKLN